jgi:hypothetical protein
MNRQSAAIQAKMGDRQIGQMTERNATEKKT